MFNATEYNIEYIELEHGYVKIIKNTSGQHRIELFVNHFVEYRQILHTALLQLKRLIHNLEIIILIYLIN